MANALYTKGKEALLGAIVDMDTDDIRAVLVDTADYTVNLSTDDNLDDIPVGARVATMASTLTGLSITNGVFDAGDVTFTSVTGDQSEAVVIYQNTGVESTSRLIVYLDSATGLPVTPNGGDISITWNASGIFTIA